MKPAIFIASSSEQLAISEAVEVNLSDFCHVSTWKLAFRVGQSFFTELLQLKDRFDFAAIILTADDVLNSRGREYLSPRDNVIFELGLFLGSIGVDRVFAVIDRIIDTRIMSDYLGVKYVIYDGDRAKRDPNQALSAACVEIKQAMECVGLRPNTKVEKTSCFPEK